MKNLGDTEIGPKTKIFEGRDFKELRGRVGYNSQI